MTPALLATLTCAALVSHAGLASAQSARTGAPGPASAPSAQAADDLLPIRRITLYRSGVGFFHREGRVSGDAEVSLTFKAEQINDILKSLVLLDLSGGRVDAVSYSSKDPIQRRLESFGVDLSDSPGTSKLLSRLRGARVKLLTPEGEFSGTIMSVEDRPTVIGGGDRPPNVVQLPWINLVTDAGVRSVNLTNVSGFELLDKALADELNKALAALAEYRTDNVKSVDLRLSGPDEPRRVVAAYVQESPVWKTSYRLVLGERDAKSRASGGGATTGDNTPTNAGTGAGQGVLQGWAIVENTTDADWTDVTLALVAGRPVSFEMDLYEPLYLDRPEVPVPVVTAAAPRIYQGSIGVEFKARSQSRRSRRAVAAAAPSMAAGRQSSVESAFDAESDQAPAMSVDELAGYSPAALAQGEQAGETFFFELTDPVTIERQRSAMIPFLSANVPTRRVSIFNADDRPDHPMRGVEITNPSDQLVQLLPGPVTVFEGDSGRAMYAGDAQISTIPAGDKRLLAYAVDLDVEAIVKPEFATDVRRLRIVNGVIERTVLSRQQTSYAFQNKDRARPRTIVIEHAKLPGWELVEPDRFSEQTPQLYRFEVGVDAGAAGTLDVVQEQIQTQQLAVIDFDLPTILAYARDGKVSPGVVEAFQEISVRRTEISQAEQNVEMLRTRTNEISQDQARIRQNMSTIDRNTDLYRRYATKLNEQESELEGLNERLESEQQRLRTLRDQLDAFIGGLSVD